MSIVAPALSLFRPAAGQPSPELSPVTYQQEWVWSLLAGKNSLDFLARTYAWRLCGFVDVEIMRSSLEAITRRHTLLRTGIAIQMGRPQLHMHASNESRLEVVNLSRTSKSEAEDEARQLLEGLACRPPAASGRCSFEFRVLRIDDCNHVLAVTMHHMFTDLTSLRVLVEELWQCYGDLLRNRVPALQSSPVQYYEYAIWQRSTHDQWSASHAGYWKASLLGAERFRLPAAKEPTSVSPHSLAELREPFDLRLTSAIADLARRERTMTPIVILASYAVVIRRWSNQRKVIIPFNVSGRYLPMHEAMLGPLGQMLFITIELSGSESLIDVVRQVSREFSTAHEHLDFAKVSMQHPELLESGFLQYLPRDPTEMAGLPEREHDEGIPNLEVEAFTFNGLPQNATMRYDTTLQIVNTKKGFLCRLWYRKDLFTAHDMREFLHDLRRVFEQFVVDPSTRVPSFKGNE